MNKANGKITRRELLAGSAAAGGLAMLGSPTITMAQAAAGANNAVTAPMDDLAGLLRGDLIMPGHGGYDEARQV